MVSMAAASLKCSGSRLLLLRSAPFLDALPLLEGLSFLVFLLVLLLFNLCEMVRLGHSPRYLNAVKLATGRKDVYAAEIC